MQNLCDAMGVSMISGPHCYSFFEGNAAFEAREELTCFYLTDFLVRQFDAFFWRPMGLDKHPQLRDMPILEITPPSSIKHSSKTPRLEAKAQDCAAGWGLPYEYRFTGYGDLTPALAALSPKLLGRRCCRLHHARHHRPQPV